MTEHIHLFYPVPTTLRCVASAISASSLTLTYVAQWQLRRAGAFSTKPKVPSRFVVDGLYSKIRHPIYFFHFQFLVFLGIALQCPWISLFALLVLEPFQLWRASKEEALLLSQTMWYRSYVKQTWF